MYYKGPLWKNLLNKPALAFVALLIPAFEVSAVLEEVVVTAQKRTESVQDVPVAVTAFSGETLKLLNATDASALVNLTPGLNAGSQAGSNRNYFLRGVGTADFHLTAAAAVGQYYDEITLTSGFHARAALFDMERVEVLKGPQNTLFGLNTTGGAINYISRKPEIGAGLNGHVTVRAGDDSLVNTEAAVGFDLGNALAARLALQTNKQGGFRSITDGRDYGDDDMMAYRAAFLLEPSDEMSVLLNLHGMQSENNGSAVQAVGTRHPDGSNRVCPGFVPGVINFEADTDCLSRNGAATGEPATDPSTGDWDTVTINLGFEDISTMGYYLKLDYDFDWVAATVLTAWDNLELQVAHDSDGGATIGTHLFQEDDRDTWQHELRLVSPGDRVFRWIAGVYYLNEEAESLTGFRSPRNGGGNIMPNVQLDHGKENLGLYFQGEFDPFERFTLTGGLRWSDEKIIADYMPSRPNVAAFSTSTPLFSAQVDALVREQFAGSAGFDQNGYEIARQVRQELPNEDVGYTVKLDWKATDNTLFYASFSKGFKGSAADTRAVYALVPVANVISGLEETRLAPESLEAWEVGLKATFWDNRVQIDGAGFFYTYENLQQFSTAGGVPVLINAPESEILGMDANLKFASGNGFFVDFGFSVIDSEITDATGSPFLEGGRIANTPDYSLFALAMQDVEFGNGQLLTLTLNVNHTDDILKNTLLNANTITEGARTQPAYTLVNADVTWRFGQNRRFGISIFGNNLSNEHYCGSRGMNDQGNVYRDWNGMGLRWNYNVTCRVDRGSMRTWGAYVNMEF